MVPTPNPHSLRFAQANASQWWLRSLRKSGGLALQLPKNGGSRPQHQLDSWDPGGLRLRGPSPALGTSPARGEPHGPGGFQPADPVNGGGNAYPDAQQPAPGLPTSPTSGTGPAPSADCSTCTGLAVRTADGTTAHQCAAGVDNWLTGATSGIKVLVAIKGCVDTKFGSSHHLRQILWGWWGVDEGRLQVIHGVTVLLVTLGGSYWL